MSKVDLKSNIPIKAKLIAIIIPTIAIAISLIIISSYSRSKKIITNSANALLETSSKKQVNQIESWLNENLSSFKAVKTSLESTSLNAEMMQNLLNKYYKYNKNYPEGFYIGDASGNLLKAKDSKKTVNKVQESMWYKQGITRVNMAYGTTYKNEAGKDTISASGILNDKSSIVKVISADIYLDKISIIVNSMIEMNNAEAFLVDNNDKAILAHRESSLISTKLDTNNSDKFLRAVATKLENKDYTSDELEKNLVVFKPIQGTEWTLISYVPTKSIFAELTKLRTFMITICIISIGILVVLIERVVQLVINPIKNLTKVIGAMTNGDFTVEVEAKGHDEISAMLKGVKEFIAAMRNMINHIGTMANNMSKQAEGSIVISNELHDSSKLQSESMQNLNTTVDELSISVNEVAKSTTTLAQVVSNTRDDGINVNERMKATISISEKGRSDMEKVNAAMENIRDSIGSLEEAINKVGRSSNEITNIVGVIGSIAEQTNLLSLNASIEAARAGESGKGFVVVASEIGNLAKTSSESVQNISELTNEINKLVTDTIRQYHESAEYISESSYLISNSADTFDNIFENINGTNGLIQEMIEKVSHLDDVAATVAAIAQEQSASSQEILQTSEIMVSQADNITANSQKVANDALKLSNTSNELNEEIRRFKV